MELKLTKDEVKTIIEALHKRAALCAKKPNAANDRHGEELYLLEKNVDEQLREFEAHENRNGQVETLAHYRGLDDRTLVIQCLWYKGELTDRIGESVSWECYTAADGFGAGLLSDELMEINDGWDWSHIRDSSDQAFAAMANILRPLLPAIVEGPVSVTGRRTL